MVDILQAVSILVISAAVIIQCHVIKKLIDRVTLVELLVGIRSDHACRVDPTSEEED